MAAPCRALGATTSNVPVAILQAFENEERMMGTAARCFVHRPLSSQAHAQQYLGSHVLRTSRRSSKSSRGVVALAAGEPLKASAASLPTSSAGPSLHGVPTKAISDRAAPYISFETPVQGSLISNEPKIWKQPENYKDERKEAQEMERLIQDVRGMFHNMTDGEISVSAYDTAWVALVPAFNGSGRPQFPKALQWILENQFSDGSWGDLSHFQYYDRVINTLACIIALKTWKTGSAGVEKGAKFIRQNLQAMETEVGAHMMIGFEIVFPALISYAKNLELDLPYDAPIISTIAAEREKKIAKIPMDILHKVPTTVLHSLEGFHEILDWEKLLKLQSEDGSFLCSPASTAACLLHVEDEKAVRYLTNMLDRFNNGVPNVYPVDLFEHLWLVDRIERLGIARYFEKDIKQSLDYVYKYFNSFGIGWARGSVVQDIDDTAMGFRLLRLHGYDVKEDVFRQFKGKDSDFFCFAGQSGQAVTGLFNFYRATQARFPGETLLETGEHFARSFLEERHRENECFDKWIISKDLPGEVEYALRTPWYYSIPRLETKSYLGQYDPNDIWIGKSLYRMAFVNNETLLALAKADFNLCQAKHQEDLQACLRWSNECGFGKLPFSRQTCIEQIFAASCILPAPEMSLARLVWAQNGVLMTLVGDFFEVGSNIHDIRKFGASTREWNPSLMDGTPEEAQIVFNGFYNTINAMSREGTLLQGRDVGKYMQQIWMSWVDSITMEAEWTASKAFPTLDEYLTAAVPSKALEAVLLCTLYFLGEPITDELINDPERLRLVYLINHVGRLTNDIQSWERESAQDKPNYVTILWRQNPDWTEEEVIADIRATVQASMQELVRLVHEPSHIPKSIRQLHFNGARLLQFFYRRADGLGDRVGMADYYKSVLFQPV